LVYFVFYRLNDNFACVNAHPDLQIWIIQAGHSVLHCKGRQAAADGMILMWLRSTKDRHHPVALRLVDDALISGDRFSHEIQNGLETPHSGFGIAQTIDKLGGVANVRKQNSKSFTLSTFGVQRFQYLLPRLIWYFCGYCLQSSTATPTKACRRSVQVPAGAALNSESGPTPLAKIIGGLILMTATQTFHDGPCTRSGPQILVKL
jgi:hypothetical protein